ncbi:MAG TPA: glycosyltransferase [Thermoanaerobaculia bacterium]|nr:glycosyltransferase [Thermoanaerobaculia bacterium]
MSSPLVTVIVGCYNHVGFVEESLLSALQQDYENLEVIVADDGSTDGTVEKILELARQWPERLVPIVGEPNVGITRNCNRALSRRRGQYVCFLSGDDVFVQGKVRKQVEWLHGGADRVACGHAVEGFDSVTGQVRWVSSEPISLRSRRSLGAIVERGLFLGLSLMVRADALPAYGYDERVGIMSDFKLQLDCVLGGGACHYIDEVLARYRIHEKSITQRSMREESAHRAFLEGSLTLIALVEAEHPALAKSCSKSRSRLLFAAGRWNARQGRMEIARAYYRAALRHGGLGAWKAVPAVLLTLGPRVVRDAVERVLSRREIVSREVAASEPQ